MTGALRQSGGDMPPPNAHHGTPGPVAVLLAHPITAALESPTIEQESETTDELDLPWQVVVHNDPVNLMSYVTMVFQKVFGFTRERAEKHMLEVHQQGR